jgi:hypothetical protein
VVGLVVVLLVGVGAVGQAVLRNAGAPGAGRPAAVGSGPGARPGGPTAGGGSLVPDQDAAQLDALTALLADRSRAVLSGDRAAWLATVDPQGAAFRAAQGQVFDHLDGIPFSDWHYEYLGRAPELSPQRRAALGGDAWVARVLAGYRLRGFDATTSNAEQYLTLVRRGERWYVASQSDGGTAPQPWDLGPVRLARGERVIVLGTASAAALRGYAEAGDRAVERVSEVWGTHWSRRAVLIAPRTQAQFGQLLLRGADGLSQVAAVTTGDLAGDGGADAERAGNDRVVINPAAFARLGPTGRRVVLTHEMTHIAVRQSTTSAVPIWLSEGFADFVGYRGTGVSRRTGAGDLLVQVRHGHGPRTLPTADDFDPTRTTIAPSYSASWLACSLIADRYGTARLVALYRRAATAPTGGAPADPQAQLAAAFERVLGVSEAGFTRSWRSYLDELAAA